MRHSQRAGRQDGSECLNGCVMNKLLRESCHIYEAAVLTTARSARLLEGDCDDKHLSFVVRSPSIIKDQTNILPRGPNSTQKAGAARLRSAGRAGSFSATCAASRPPASLDSHAGRRACRFGFGTQAPWPRSLASSPLGRRRFSRPRVSPRPPPRKPASGTVTRPFRD